MNLYVCLDSDMLLMFVFTYVRLWIFQSGQFDYMYVCTMFVWMFYLNNLPVQLQDNMAFYVLHIEQMTLLCFRHFSESRLLLGALHKRNLQTFVMI